MRLYKNGAFVEDAWRTLGDEEAPGADPALVSLKRWQAIREGQDGSNLPIGVRLEGGELVEAILPDLGRLALVALVFPKFSDGRSFSKAAQLRQHGFSGELRAMGDVLWDQLQLMRRCGFDAFAIENEPTIRALEAGKKPFMDEFYQPGLGAEAPADARRPWVRRAAAH